MRSSVVQTIRSDPALGVREEFGFFGRGPSKMFGSVHLPKREGRAGVLICSSLQSEFLVNYRREVLLARALAARGIAVERFHYRGTGHSDGEGQDVTFGTMVEDAAEAATWLRDRAGVEHVGILGTRWGALIAAAVASGEPGAPLALWEPSVDGASYFQEVFRFRRMSQLSRGRAKPQTDPIDEMTRSGYSDVFGFAIDRAIYESSRGRVLEGELGPVPRPVLLIQVDRRTHLRSGYASLVATWKQAGCSVDVRLIQGQEAWWFPGAQIREAARERSEATIAATADWLCERLATRRLAARTGR
jgi:pimeloyl-ACP methyl ester carboxylesterase